MHESTADESDSDNEAVKIRGPVLQPAISQEASSGKRVLSPEEKLLRATKLRKALLPGRK